MKLKKSIDKFFNWLEVIKNKSPKTVEQYNRHLKYFQSYIKQLIENGKLEGNLEEFEIENIDLDLAEGFRTYIYKK